MRLNACVRIKNPNYPNEIVILYQAIADFPLKTIIPDVSVIYFELDLSLMNDDESMFMMMSVSIGCGDSSWLSRA